MTNLDSAVIEAAKKWLLAKEAVLAADEAREDPLETERAMTQVEADLADAVYKLLGRGPHTRRS